MLTKVEEPGGLVASKELESRHTSRAVKKDNEAELSKEEELLAIANSCIRTAKLYLSSEL